MRQSKNSQTQPSFRATQPVLALAGESAAGAFLEMQKFGSVRGTPPTRLPWMVSLTEE